MSFRVVPYKRIFPSPIYGEWDIEDWRMGIVSGSLGCRSAFQTSIVVCNDRSIPQPKKVSNGNQNEMKKNA